MKREEYQKPSMKVVMLKHQCHLLAGSGETPNNVPLWDGEGG